ncbi:sugar phosphate isomerase/epimerase [Ramlibacter sp. G-1-2-2]|uniref:Sugar phosphate isomerase/epimerase n=1 Tax=Ramlibacter agri TaxID=2728837 RepID=A0A848HG87_9BURK|nr:sugar phosphate isomerase/epimerase family protein [Ramlibacter agri]NML46658.1 sugar phosphate isomerase/epimerase [Ramlibacter agri]
MRFALCNEVLQPLPFAQQCKLAADLGYDGLEVAPFTLAADPMALKDSEAAVLRRVAEDHGLKIFGLHWLLVAPAGLSIVDEDAAVRSRTVAVMQRLCELCALLGGSYLVHGSPKQRSVPAGSSRAQAYERARDCFAQAAKAAAQAGVIYCVEPLSPRETDLLNTVAEAAELVREVGQPALRTMIDCSAAGQAESEPVHALMQRWLPTGLIGHVQVNDPNRRGPGQGDLDFGPILRVLRDAAALGQFPGIVAAEPFDYVPDGPGCAARAIGYLQGVLSGQEGHG